ncbi:MAG: amidohydrolase family protein [Planctomycetota bacterium]|jgi:predicted TIM-barrel fold metal-dependent hydrolase
MGIDLSRREVIKGAVGLAGMAGCSATEKRWWTANKSGEPGWIDAHVHVWTDDEERYPRAPRYRGAKLNPATFRPKELFTHCRPCGVQRINLIQSSCYGFDNRYMLHVMENYPGTFGGTAIVDVNARNVADTMRQLGSRGVRSFRIMPRLTQSQPADWLRPEGYRTMFKAATRLNQAISCLIDTNALPELDRMCGLYPDTAVIIDHLCRIRAKKGTIDRGQVDALLRMSRHQRVSVKVGAFYALSGKEAPYDDLLLLIKQVTEVFGPGRCMWETDSPYQITRGGSYEPSLAVIRDLCDFLSPADKEQILRKTAESLFFGCG